MTQPVSRRPIPESRPIVGAVIERATVADVSPLTVITSTAITPVPARLPVSPTISVAAGARVLVVFNEGELIILARLT